MLILTKQYTSVVFCFFFLPSRAIPKRENLGWAPSSCASPAFCRSPVLFVEMLVSLWLTSGADRITASSDGREPCRGLSLGSLLCAPIFSTCQGAGGECVFIFRSSGGPHDPVRHRAHAQARARTYSFTAVRTQGGLRISATRARASKQASAYTDLTRPLSIWKLRVPLCSSVSARLSVGPAQLLGVGWRMVGGFTDVGRRGFQMFLRWFHQSAPSLFIVSTLWQTITLTCAGS